MNHFRAANSLPVMYERINSFKYVEIQYKVFTTSGLKPQQLKNVTDSNKLPNSPVCIRIVLEKSIAILRMLGILHYFEKTLLFCLALRIWS